MAFAIFDTQNAGLTGTHRIVWAGHGCHSPHTNPPTVNGIRDFALACQRGETNWQAWNWIQDLSGSPLLILDNEAQPIEAQLTLFETFKNTAPGVMLGTYSVPVDKLTDNHEQCIAYYGPTGVQRTAARAMVAERLKLPGVKQVGNVVDVICADVYLLHPDYIERDLKFIRCLIKLTREKWPGKRVYAWCWGCYHTNWNPPGTLIEGEALDRYVKAIVASGADGCVVWASQEGDSKLILPALLAKVNQ